MKKFLTAALSLTLAAGACLGMAGCKPKQEEVFDGLFKAMTATNITVASKAQNSYDKSAVTADGEYDYWRSVTSTACIDYDNMAYSEVGTREMYGYEDGSAVTITTNSESYMFVQSDRYFKVDKNTDEDTATDMPWIIQEYSDKDGFLNGDYISTPMGSSHLDGLSDMLGSITGEASYQVTEAAVMQSLMEWNKDIEKYEISLGLVSLQTTVLDDDAGTVLYLDYSKTDEQMVVEYTYSKIGSTVVSIPDAVKTAVSTYITENPVES